MDFFPKYLHNLMIVLQFDKKGIIIKKMGKGGLRVLLSLDELRDRDFSVCGIRVFHQKPVFRQQVHPGRKCNGFVFLLRGKCRFSYSGGSFTMEPDALCYLPFGSNHVFEILTEDTEFYRIDFTVKVEDEIVLFSNGPLLLTNHTPAECMGALQKLVEKYAIVSDSVAKMELLCAMFRSLAKASMPKLRTAPAVERMQNHPAERLPMGQLARLCGLSTARFYAVFALEHGMTPMAYRDELLMQRARLMLSDGDFSVGEVADALGFESAAYFSRFFKKHDGVPPSRCGRKGDAT